MSALRGRPHAFAALLCAGISLANALRIPFAPAVAAAVAAALAAALVGPRFRGLVLGAALALAGLSWGSARLDALDRSVLAPSAGRVERAVVVVTGPARHTQFAVRVPARVESFGRRRLSESVLLQLPRGRAPPLGGRLDLVAKVELPRQSSSGFDEREWLRRKGVHVVLRAGPWRLVGRRGGLPGAADRLHATLARTIAPGLSGERRAIIRGIVLGEDEGLSDELRDAFRASGLYHLLAVSGQNVALLAGGLLILAWLLGLPRLAAEVGALAAICAYVLAVGWQPSVVRAGVAGGLASLAWITARQRDRWWFFLLGALVLLAWNPYALREPGFQLSFAAVAAIFVAVPRLRALLDGYPLPDLLRDAVAVSSACGIVTAPILWLQFGSVPLWSVPANALAAPAVGPLLGLGLGAAALEPFAPGTAALVAWVNGWAAAYLAWCARSVAGLPLAQLDSARALVAVALLPLLVFVGTRLRPPQSIRALVLAALVAASAVAWRPVVGPEPVPPPHGFRLTLLDVGQGDGYLLQAPGAAVLVDEGPPEANVAGQLQRLGVRRLDAIVLTHPQRDHVGGAAAVLGRLHVRTILDPRLPSDSPDERSALAAARRRDVPVVTVRAGQTFRIGDLRLRVLWPDGPGSPHDDPNLHATVLLASYGEIDALLTADAESDVTLPLHPPPVEILKVAHHGSADARLPELLVQLRPLVALISVGADNDYGHPAPSTLTALARFPGLRVFRTDRDGRVVLDSDGRRIWVRDER